MLDSVERRAKLLAVMNVRRYDTINNLAFEFNVSRRTIRYDIEILSNSSPIYTVTGRHGGGVYILEGFSAEMKYMTNTQIELLTRLSLTLNSDDRTVMQSILNTFSVPTLKRK